MDHEWHSVGTTILETYEIKQIVNVVKSKTSSLMTSNPNSLKG